ncbi:hypothetical protein R6Z07M_017632 [Ovis aries]
MRSYAAPLGARPCSDSGNSSKRCRRPALEIVIVQSREADRKSTISLSPTAAQASTSRCTCPVSNRCSYAARRRRNRGGAALVPKRLREAPGEKPEVLKTRRRGASLLPGAVGSAAGVHNGKTFSQVETKPEMTGHYPGGFSITYKPVKQGRPGIQATPSSRFIPK